MAFRYDTALRQRFSQWGEKLGWLIPWLDTIDQFATLKGRPDLAASEMQDDIRQMIRDANTVSDLILALGSDTEDRGYWQARGRELEATETAERYVGAMQAAIRELEASHQPIWVDANRSGYTLTPRVGFDPVGCSICYPGEGDWPCVTAEVAADLRDRLPQALRP